MEAAVQLCEGAAGVVIAPVLLLRLQRLLAGRGSMHVLFIARMLCAIHHTSSHDTMSCGVTGRFQGCIVSLPWKTIKPSVIFTYMLSLAHAA